MEIKEIREMTGTTKTEFAKRYKISYRTLQSWENGERKPPEYAKYWLERLVSEDVKAALTSH